MRKPRSEYPSEQSDKFLVRLPDGMRGRIAAAAKENNRSMNAEIVRVLEDAFPEPVSMDELIADIKQHVETMKKFRGPTMFMALADSLDELILEVSRARETPPEDRAVADKFLNEHLGVRRFVPPRDD